MVVGAAVADVVDGVGGGCGRRGGNCDVDADVVAGGAALLPAVVAIVVVVERDVMVGVAGAAVVAAVV